MSDSVWPHRCQPTRLPPSLGFSRQEHWSGLPFPSPLWLPAAAAVKSLQSCPTLCDPVDGSPPGSSVPGILQARILEWVAISFSSGLKLTMVYTRSGDGVNCTLLACFCFQWGKLYFFSQKKKEKRKRFRKQAYSKWYLCRGYKCIIF